MSNQEDNISPEQLQAVDDFAEDMKRKLRTRWARYDGWDRTSARQLVERIDEERYELQSALESTIDGDMRSKLQNIIDEAADVANFAMMIADKARKQLRGLDHA